MKKVKILCTECGRKVSAKEGRKCGMCDNWVCYDCLESRGWVNMLCVECFKGIENGKK